MHSVDADDICDLKTDGAEGCSNRRGSPGGSPYRGWVNYRSKSLNTIYIGRARLLPSRGGPNHADFA